MRVEIVHTVDWVPGGESYNFLDYDFVLSDCRIGARAYADTMSDVSIKQRSNVDGSPAYDPVAMNQAIQSGDQARMLEFFSSTDPRRASEFPEVLAYLRERFARVQLLGPGGYETIAVGLSPEEISERVGEVVTVTVSANLAIGGNNQ